MIVATFPRNSRPSRAGVRYKNNKNVIVSVGELLPKKISPLESFYRSVCSRYNSQKSAAFTEESFCDLLTPQIQDTDDFRRGVFSLMKAVLPCVNKVVKQKEK